MPKAQRQSGELVAPAVLPAELWQRIASFLSLKVWARTAAPTCKAHWNLQLLDCVLEPGNLTGLRWAMPRMQRPRRLSITLSTGDALDFLAMRACRLGLQDLSGLLELQLYGVEGNLHCALALEGLLRQATSLKGLSTNLTAIMPLGLKHLVVRCDVVTDCKTLCRMLPLFNSLETLSLGSNTNSTLCIPSPVLLQGLGELRSVQLYRLHFSAIRLAKRCELHLFVTGEALLTSKVWEPVLDNIRSIRFKSAKAELKSLPMVLRRARKCRFVSILAAKVGTAKEPMQLEGGITMVSKLYISAKLHLRIPAVTWKSICFYNCHELNIRMDRPGCTWRKLFSIVDTFYFSYYLLHGACSMDMGMAASRLKGSRRVEIVKSTSYSSVCSPANAHPDGDDKCTASCGACPICLMAEQVLVLDKHMDGAPEEDASSAEDETSDEESEEESDDE